MNKYSALKALFIIVVLAGFGFWPLVDSHSESEPLETRTPAPQPPAQAAESQFQAGLESLQRGEAAQGYALLAPLAQQGDSRAQYLIGLLYAKGLHLPQDFEAARLWYTLAAEQGHTGAQNNLGLMYKNGEGGPASLVDAYAWFARASVAGDDKALNNRDSLAEDLGPQAITHAQKIALDWRPKKWSELVSTMEVPDLPKPTVTPSLPEKPALAPASGNSTQSAAAPSQSITGELRGALRQGPDLTDPTMETGDYTLTMNCFDRLVESEPQAGGGSKIVPGLAESWEISEDGLVITLHLRKNVIFHNNAPFTVDDVIHTFERILNPKTKSPAAGLLSFIKGAREMAAGEIEPHPYTFDGTGQHTIIPGITILDPFTLQLTLERPYVPFLSVLSEPQLSILPKPNSDPIKAVTAPACGSGPYKLLTWEPRKHIVLQANDQYWRGAPAIKKVNLRIVANAEEARNLFQQGELDYLDCAQYPEILPQVMSDQNLHAGLEKQGSGELYFLAFNNSQTPFDTLLIRKALQLSVDREAMIKVLHNAALTVEGVIPPGMNCWSPLPGRISMNRDVARELLAQAGYPDGMSFKLATLADDAPLKDITANIHELEKIIVASAREVGVDVQLVPLSLPEFNARLFKGELSSYVGHWRAEIDDPDVYFHTFFSRRGSLIHSTGYNSKPIQLRVEKATELPNMEERCSMYNDLGRIIAQQDAAWLPLISPLRVLARGPGLKRFPLPCNDKALSFSQATLTNSSPMP